MTTGRHNTFISCVRFDPDGRALLTGDGREGLSEPQGRLRFWTLDGEPVEDELVGHADVVVAADFSPDGRLIATASADRTLRLWDRHGYQLGGPIQAHRSDVERMVCLSDGEVLSCDGRELRLWDCCGKRLGEAWPGHEDYIYALALAPGGHMVASGDGKGVVRLWNSRGESLDIPPLEHKVKVDAVAFSQDGALLVVGCADGMIVLWDLRTGQRCEQIHGLTGQTSVLDVSGCGDDIRIVSGGSDGYVYLWKRGGTRPVRCAGHEGFLRTVAFSQDGKWVISGGEDRTIRRWDMEGKLVGNALVGHQEQVNRIARGPDEQTIVSASSDGTVALWDLREGLLIERIRGHRGPVWSVTVTPDGSCIISGGKDGTLRFWRGGSWRDWYRIACDRLEGRHVLTGLRRKERESR